MLPNLHYGAALAPTGRGAKASPSWLDFHDFGVRFAGVQSVFYIIAHTRLYFGNIFEISFVWFERGYKD